MIPTPFTVTVREWAPTGVDDEHGNPIADWFSALWQVHGIAPGAMQDTDDQNRDKSIIAWTVYGPMRGGYPRTPRAEIMLPGGAVWYPVDGMPDDWTRGPWDHPFAGLSVALRRVEG